MKNRSKPIGTLAECADVVARRIGDRMEAMTDTSIRECIVWTDPDGNVYASRSDSMSAMRAEKDRQWLICVYSVVVSKRRDAPNIDVTNIAEDLRYEQEQRKQRAAA